MNNDMNQNQYQYQNPNQGQFQNQYQYQQNQYQYQYPQQPPESPGFGVASMVLGIVSLCLSCCAYFISIPCAIVGIILGLIGLKKKAGRGMATAGLVCSIISFIPAIVIISTGASIVSTLNNF